jgi:hypothetical protein
MTLDQGVANEGTRANWVKILLVLGMLIDAAAILSGLAQQELLSRAASGVGITHAEAVANDARHGMIGIFQFAAFLATAACWLVWLHRAYANLRLMGTERSDYTPGWAVGYWFIPILNLFRPYQITKEVWLRSAGRNAVESIKGLPPAAILSWWWGVYLISNLLGQALLRLSSRADTIEKLQRVTSLGIALDAIGILSAGLALAVVRRIDLFQKDTISNSDEPMVSDVTA